MNSFKKALPNILVVSSILSLLAFLVFWNILQYEQAESTLRKELSFHLESAMNETQHKQLNSFIKRLDINVVKKGEHNFFKSEDGDSLSKIVVWIDSLDVDAVDGSWLKSEKKKYPLDSCLNNAKVFKFKEIKEGVARGNKDANFPQRLNGLDLFDLESLHQNSEERRRTFLLFEERLKENKLPNQFVVSNDSIKTFSDVITVSYESKGTFSRNKELDFQYPRSYLFGKILSSLFFSFFLLTLVILAFVVVLRSWKEQKRIIVIKNDFISNMTHELKTPISTVSVAIEAIRKFDVLKDKAKTEEYLDISSNELGRLSLLVEKVLRMSLFENGKGFLNPQSVDLSLIVKETLHTMKMHFEERQVLLQTDLIDSPLFVKGDKVHLTNVVYNLIENAIKYSGDQIEINVSTKRVGSKVLLTISDKGIGIPLEHQKQIFTKFYRVPNHDRHNVKGHGLGLSYVKQVIDELGGSIDLKSQKAKGSSFIIHLKGVKE